MTIPRHHTRPTPFALAYEINQLGRDGSEYLVNVVLRRARKPVTKLRAILRLLTAGYTVTCTNASAFHVALDGVHFGTLDDLDLDTFAKRTTPLPTKGPRR